MLIILISVDYLPTRCVQNIEVEHTKMMKPSLSSFLSEVKKSPQARSQETQVGGSMGLWLGLGVLQAAEIATNFFLAKILPRIVNKLSNGDQILTQQ